MNLKVSLFNKSIFKTDMKRFWIASLLYTVMLFFLVPFQYVAREERFWGIINTIPDEYIKQIPIVTKTITEKNNIKSKFSKILSLKFIILVFPLV